MIMTLGVEHSPGFVLRRCGELLVSREEGTSE